MILLLMLMLKFGYYVTLGTLGDTHQVVVVVARAIQVDSTILAATVAINQEGTRVVETMIIGGARDSVLREEMHSRMRSTGKGILPRNTVANNYGSVNDMELSDAKTEETE